jgi:anti-sigma-K factor RskA
LQSHTPEPEDGMILALLTGDGLDDPAAPVGPEDERRRREYVELLGLLPYGLEPMAPRPEVRQRLLATIAGSERPGPQPVTAPPAHHQRWPLALAASLVVALLAGAVLFYSRWQGAEVQLASVQAELASVQAEMGEELATLRHELAEVSNRLAMVTMSGTEICPLHPMDEAQAVARGTLYVMPDGSGWYLRLRSLAPVPPGREYQIWFATSGGAVSGGTFEMAAPKQEVELTSEQMPTGIEAVFLTIEPEGGMPNPTGPQVLYGDEKMQVL